MRRIALLGVAAALALGAAACGGAGDEESRHDKTVEVIGEVQSILHDPESYGTEAEVVDLLAALATEDARMVDDALGAGSLRSGWYQTLYESDVDAEIVVFHEWVADDGSQSGTLWLWRGTNQRGEPFELIGVNIDSHDEQGRITESRVIYPYTDEYVAEAFEGGGTPVSPEEIWHAPTR